MAQIPFRGNLQAATFPLLSKLAGRTVIDPGPDQTYFQLVSANAAAPTDRGVPNVVYAHNVMPSTYGWQSVKYNNVYFAPPSEEAAIFSDIHFVQCTRGGQVPAPTGTKTYLSLAYDPFAAEAFMYVMDVELGNWRRITGGLTHPTTGDPFVFTQDTVLTSTTVNGVTYLYASGIGCFLYDDTIDVLLFRELAGLDPVDILGISSSNGYMFAWTINSIAWSSVINVEDFEPSDISGAGGGSLQEAQGAIVGAISTVHGLIIFTEENAVSAVYSGNEEFPWNFKAIPGSGGVANKQQFSLDQAEQYYYAFTTKGIQQVTHLRVNTALPHISDFISGGIFEDFDSVTKVFSTVKLAGAMKKALTTIGDRYVVMSYAVAPEGVFTHAIVLDLLQGRLGKLKVEHTQVFERKDLTFGNIDTPRDIIGFVTSSGLCKALDFDDTAISTDSVLLLGKFQLQRSRLVEAQELELENAGSSGPLEVTVYASPNGKELGNAQPAFLREETENSQQWLLQGVGINLSILLIGTFNIISYVLWTNPHGRY